MPDIRFDTTTIVVLSGRLSATSAVLLCDHECFPTSHRSIMETSCGRKVYIMTDLLPDVSPFNRDTTEVWVHRETGINRRSLDFCRSDIEGRTRYHDI